MFLHGTDIKKNAIRHTKSVKKTEENDNFKTNGISNTNEEVMAKMFNLMETFTNRIMKLEERINDETKIDNENWKMDDNG